jgi:hypothetical protein
VIVSSAEERLLRRAPDGICVDAENAVRYADVPNKVRVADGCEVLQTVEPGPRWVRLRTGRS